MNIMIELAFSAQRKLNQEVSRDDHNLLRIVGHANIIDSIQNLLRGESRDKLDAVFRDHDDKLLQNKAPEIIVGIEALDWSDDLNNRSPAADSGLLLHELPGYEAKFTVDLPFSNTTPSTDVFSLGPELSNNVDAHSDDDDDDDDDNVDTSSDEDSDDEDDSDDDVDKDDFALCTRRQYYNCRMLPRWLGHAFHGNSHSALVKVTAAGGQDQ